MIRSHSFEFRAHILDAEHFNEELRELPGALFDAVRFSERGLKLEAKRLGLEPLDGGRYRKLRGSDK